MFASVKRSSLVSRSVDCVCNSFIALAVAVSSFLPLNKMERIAVKLLQNFWGVYYK
jgi:hypothetical protein